MAMDEPWAARAAGGYPAHGRRSGTRYFQDPSSTTKFYDPTPSAHFQQSPPA